MRPSHSCLAVFAGSKTRPRSAAWNALTEPQRRPREQEGIGAWQSWSEQQRGAIIARGGPLGKTKRVDPQGPRDITNQLAAFTVVRAPCLDAAPRMLGQHSHFTLFPGEAIEVMPIPPIPGA